MSISRQNLSIVIVTFKSEGVIHECIKSIDKDIKITVVENSNNYHPNLIHNILIIYEFPLLDWWSDPHNKCHKFYLGKEYAKNSLIQHKIYSNQISRPYRKENQDL